MRAGRVSKGEFGYIMPYDIIFRHTDEAASLMWETAKKRIAFRA